MSKHSRLIKTVPLAPKGEPKPNVRSLLEVEVYYSKGGMNYFTYKNEPRGYYLSVTPVTLEDLPRDEDPTKTLTIRSFTSFSGFKSLIESAARFNAKRLDQLAAALADAPKVQELTENVLAKNNITVA